MSWILTSRRKISFAPNIALFGPVTLICCLSDSRSIHWMYAVKTMTHPIHIGKIIRRIDCCDHRKDCFRLREESWSRLVGFIIFSKPILRPVPSAGQHPPRRSNMYSNPRSLESKLRDTWHENQPSPYFAVSIRIVCLAD